jgi:hypothetical protein
MRRLFDDPSILQNKVAVWPRSAGSGGALHLRGGRMTERVNPKGLSNSVTLEEEIADLKQVIALLRAELADLREQRDKWQSRADRVSLTAPC